MHLSKRVFAAVLALCLILPLALCRAEAAATADNSRYQLFHQDLLSLGFNSNGRVSLDKAITATQELYNKKAIDVTTVAYSLTGKTYFCYGEADTSKTFMYNGIQSQKCTLGDWVALKFRSPGAGDYSLNLESYFLNQHVAAELTGYLLPARTSKDSIPGLLTDANKIGVASIPVTTSKETFVSSAIATTLTLEANTEYLLVLKATGDSYVPEEKRVDFMITGISFGEAYTPDPNAFGPVNGQTVVEGPVQYAKYSRVVVTGVNPLNGHDLIYMMFKGGMMIVYDIDAREIYDVVEGMNNTPSEGIVDPDGIFWSCGSNAGIFRYDPKTKTKEKFNISYSMFDGLKESAQGLVLGDDGYLYFAYHCWLARLNPKTGNIERLGDALTTDPGKASDSQFTAYGGIVYKDGYLYTTLHGDLNNDLIMTSQVVKFHIATCKIVQVIDVRDTTWGDNQSEYGIYYLCNVGDVLFCNLSDRADVPAYIDISGDQMVRLDNLGDFDSDLISRFTAEMNGKYYASGMVDKEENVKCLYEYDPATRTMTRLGEIFHIATLASKGGIVTVENEPKLPGQSIVTASNNGVTGKVDLCFYNIATGETVIWDGVSGDFGSPGQLHSIVLDPTGRYLYTGAYGSNKLVRIDLTTGEMVENPTHDHQIDGMIWYEDYLWVGNYSTGTITRYDPYTDEAFALFELMNTVFQCKRMWNFSAGDGKVFCGTVPHTGRYGGVLVWYDIKNDMTYVAAGPNPEDVFYAQTTASFAVWRNAVTGQIEDFDEDGDGMFDFDLLVDDKGTADPDDDIYRQRYYGVVENRVLTSVNYVDGYIYGATSKYNGQNTTPQGSPGNAELYVYDVAQMKLVATYDLTDTIDGIINPGSGFVDTIDCVRPDPYEKGKFWGFVCDTLFSFTFDHSTNTFNVKEELALYKDKTHLITSYSGREILFEGDYLYVPFHNAGMYMVNTADPSIHYQVTTFTVNQMLRLPNGDICYLGGADGSKNGIRRLEIGQYTKSMVAASTQAVIDALPETVTMENEEQFLAAYRMYMDLTEDAKALVDADRLLGIADTMYPQLAAKADSLIEAIGAVALEKEKDIVAARDYYDNLPEAAKSLVTKLLDLELAEDELFQLKMAKNNTVKPPVVADKDTPPAPQSSNTWIFVIIGAAVVAGAAVAAVVILKKKKKA